jgi:hypothetical protein
MIIVVVTVLPQMMEDTKSQKTNKNSSHVVHMLVPYMGVKRKYRL